MTVAIDDPALSANAQVLMRQLLLVWLEFERRLGRISLVHRLEQGNFSVEDYRRLLFNLRPQVVEGARWITRAASSFTSDHVELRSTIIGHAYAEHRDYELLESDYVAVGGSIEEIRRAPRNVGTEALAAYLMHQASLPNPADLLGAMFIIEGLGNKMASAWAERIQNTLGIASEATRFLTYHGKNDATHMAKLHAIVNSDAVNEETTPRIVKTAKVVARLYALQLEELDNV
jgi:3-oxoacyl-[acyl-carrier-protein] synthase III